MLSSLSNRASPEPTSSRPPLTSDCDSSRVLALASGACRSKRWREAGDAAHRLLMFEFLTTCKHIGWISVAAAVA
jgi:hypothetical protein